MRKRIVSSGAADPTTPEGEWLNLEDIAEVEITSEDPKHPIEHALLPGHSAGWRAGKAGEQTIRFLFDEPRSLRRIWIHFEESEVERTHEFVLRWSADNGKSFTDIVRQQWNFSPDGMREESENIYLDATGVTTLELIIKPDISNENAVASLAQLRIG
ncbi:carbohydrate-binding protein [Desulfonatronum sp. SC1]|uniref:carbohydrate-binding protein n=1 Tax=Desulfonatronum sp. SC1 TaxID=2109626 RepID=UPI000D3018CB|nr:carbohydrate-binding protein [Desulfonatronum sp. SC1]PTN35317.1 carbohydrate-binding protein [Desulfonatronum sp. SC1]